MKRTCFIFAYLGIFIFSFPARGEGYHADAGILTGSSFYMGDANDELFKNVHSCFGALFRYNINRRFAIKVSSTYFEISGTTVDKTEEYPNGVAFNFKHNLVNANACIEFNFYEYGAPDYMPGSSKISPYVTTGVGVLSYETNGDKTTGEIPIGLGIKYKLNHFNIVLEGTYHTSFSDKLDYADASDAFQLNDPWIAKSSWNKNKDGYFVFDISISYDLFYIGSKCYK